MYFSKYLPLSVRSASRASMCRLYRMVMTPSKKVINPNSQSERKLTNGSEMEETLRHVILENQLSCSLPQGHEVVLWHEAAHLRPGMSVFEGFLKVYHLLKKG